MTIQEKREFLSSYDPVYLTWVDEDEATDAQVEDQFYRLFQHDETVELEEVELSF